MATGMIRTSPPMMTVPVRSFTTTRAGVSPTTDSPSISEMNPTMSACRTSGTETSTDSAATALAADAPSFVLIASATRVAVVKSGCRRVRLTSSGASEGGTVLITSPLFTATPATGCPFSAFWPPDEAENPPIEMAPCAITYTSPSLASIGVGSRIPP